MWSFVWKRYLLVYYNILVGLTQKNIKDIKYSKNAMLVKTLKN